MTTQGRDRETSFTGGPLPDPAAAAKRQFEIDIERTSWRAELLERKHTRMKASSFAYLRGSAPIYYELLAACPALADGPAGEGWIVGDLHLENFGAFRVEPFGHDAEVVFDANDFDDAVIAPWRWDVLRLVVSLILAARGRQLDGSETIELARALLSSYAGALQKGKVPHMPPIVAGLVERTSERKRVEFLDSRTHVVGKERRFVRGERYAELPASSMSAVKQAVKAFVIAEGEQPDEKFLAVIDATYRIAGTGSLGCRRIAVLTEGKGSPDGNGIFDLKEEWTPSAAVLGVKSDLEPNLRVATAVRACLVRVPFALGTTTFQGRPMLGRRLMPQEDKLDTGELSAHDFGAVAPYFGALAAMVHRRGATKHGAHEWSDKDCEALLSRATVVAGWYEAAYLAFCRML